MPSILKSPLFLTILGLTLGLTAYYIILTDEPVDYNAEIKPIINQKCISCHGGVKKKGGFSLLFRDEALSPTASGKPAIIPGDAKNSDMIKRLHHKDLEERMPYKEDPLSKQEIDLLTRWLINLFSHRRFQAEDSFLFLTMIIKMTLIVLLIKNWMNKDCLVQILLTNNLL